MQTNQLLPFPDKNGLYGYIDTLGNVVIPPQFEIAWEFSEGLAAVKSAGAVGFINSTGEWVISPQFASGGYFSEGRFRYEENGRFGYVDNLGQVVIPAKYVYAGQFSGGIAPVRSCKNGFYLAVKTDGREVIKNNGMAYPICREHKFPSQSIRSKQYGFRNAEGKWTIKAQFAMTYPFAEGLAGANVREGTIELTGFLDQYGNWALPPQYREVDTCFSEGLVIIARLQRKNTFLNGAINQMGEMVIEPRFYSLRSFRSGRAVAKEKSDGKFGYIDHTGEFCIPEIFDRAEPFVGRIAKVFYGNDCLYIDTQGKKIFQWKAK